MSIEGAILGSIFNIDGVILGPILIIEGVILGPVFTIESIILGTGSHYRGRHLGDRFEVSSALFLDWFSQTSASF